MRLLTVPVLTSIMIAGLGLTLLTIVLRSPYTHTNLVSGYDPTFNRTQPIVVGSPVPYRGTGLASSAPAAANPVARGRELFVSFGCATCHGIEGRGGSVAPPIVGFSAAALRAKTSTGPGGMPVFAQDALADEDLAAIAAYLKSLAK